MSIHCQDKAKITPKGILFKGLLYSCQLAIKERWYEYAMLHGESNICICYFKSFKQTLYISIFENELVEVNCIDKIYICKIDESAKIEYYTKLQLLKEKRKLFQYNKLQGSSYELFSD